MFFFEKKNQKTFARLVTRPISQRATEARVQNSFDSFFQKRTRLLPDGHPATPVHYDFATFRRPVKRLQRGDFAIDLLGRRKRQPLHNLPCPRSLTASWAPTSRDQMRSADRAGRLPPDGSAAMCPAQRRPASFQSSWCGLCAPPNVSPGHSRARDKGEARNADVSCGRAVWSWRWRLGRGSRRGR